MICYLLTHSITGICTYQSAQTALCDDVSIANCACAHVFASITALIVLEPETFISISNAFDNDA